MGPIRRSLSTARGRADWWLAIRAGASAMWPLDVVAGILLVDWCLR